MSRLVLAAAITTRTGKALVSRQFLDVSRARIEGLLAAFPKLMSTDTQHTFVESESVRYVYQPLESLYLVLVTTKSSNIMEDLDTLHVLAKLIPEYCRFLQEDEIVRHSFELLFAFDEVIHLGHREKITLPQVKSFLSMESHEEKVAEMIERNKHREAAEEAKKRMQDIQRKRREEERSGRSMQGFGSSNMPGFGGGGASAAGAFTPAADFSKPAQTSTYAAASPAASAMKSGLSLKRAEKTDAFLQAMAKEGEEVAATLAAPAAAAAMAVVGNEPAAPPVHREKVHLLIEEKLVVELNHDGGVENVEVKGGLSVLISEAEAGRVLVKLRDLDQKTYQFKVHPNLDRNKFVNENIVALKDPSRSFPTGNPLGVLKWRGQWKDESAIPFTVSCWPSPGGGGSTAVVAEFELTRTDLELHDVCIAIPIPGGQPPRVDNAVGSHSYHPPSQTLLWRLELVDGSSPAGSMEFTVPPGGNPAGLFPVQVTFRSRRTLCPLTVAAVVTPEGAPVVYSSQVDVGVESYKLT